MKHPKNEKDEKMPETIIELRDNLHGFYDIIFCGENIGSSGNPEYKACHLLHELGITGKVAFKRPGRDQIDVRMDIEAGAKKYSDKKERLDAFNKGKKHE